MASAIFIKLTGIEGEATDAVHENEINVQSWSWGASQPGTMHLEGGGTAGRVRVSDLNFVHDYDKASPNLFQYCCKGKKIDEAVLTQLKQAGDGGVLDFLKITMTDVIVSSVNPGGGSDSIPTESVTLNFAKHKIEYMQQKAEGSGEPVVTTKFDIRKNAEW